MKRLAIVSAVGAMLLAGSAQAATIVDTGPEPATFSGYAFGGNVNGNQGVAGRFTLTQTTSITGIQFYGASLGSNLGLIRADGTTPGVSLFSSVIAGTDNSINQWIGLSGLNWVLSAGSYWVSFESPNGSAFREARNAPNPLAQQATETANIYTADNTDAFAFRVFGDAIAPTTTAAVPEAATWAMMMLGLGLVGATLRQRRPQQRTTVRFAVSVV